MKTNTKSKNPIKTTPSALRKLAKKMFAANFAFEKVPGVRETTKALGFKTVGELAVYLAKQGF